MPFATIYTNETQNKFETLGVTEISILSAMLTFYKSSETSLETMSEINLRVKGVTASCWNLFTLAVASGDGDKNAHEMFMRLKEQIVKEVMSMIEISNSINADIIKTHQEGNKTNEKIH
jgi:hypothetical protein